MNMQGFSVNAQFCCCAVTDDDQIEIDQLNDVTDHVTAIDSNYVEPAGRQQQQDHSKSASEDVNAMDDVIVEDDVPPPPSQSRPQKLITSSVPSGVCTPNAATSRSRCSSGSTSRRLSRLESLLRQQIADKDAAVPAESGSIKDCQPAPPPVRAAQMPSRPPLTSGPRYDWLGTGLDEARSSLSSRVVSGSVDRLAPAAAAAASPSGTIPNQQWQPPLMDTSNALMSRSRSVESVVSAAGTTFSMTGLPPAEKHPNDFNSFGARSQHQQQQQTRQLNGSVSLSLPGLNDIDVDSDDDTATLMTSMTSPLGPEVSYYADQSGIVRNQMITATTCPMSPMSSSTRQNSICIPSSAAIVPSDRVVIPLFTDKPLNQF
jgi:hypothetical protein